MPTPPASATGSCVRGRSEGQPGERPKAGLRDDRHGAARPADAVALRVPNCRPAQPAGRRPALAAEAADPHGREPAGPPESLRRDFLDPAAGYRGGVAAQLPGGFLSGGRTAGDPEGVPGERRHQRAGGRSPAGGDLCHHRRAQYGHRAAGKSPPHCRLQPAQPAAVG